MELKRYCGEKICLILVGDEKQRIYFDGKKNLTKDKIGVWDTFTLRVNYRSGNRIVRLSNKIANELEYDAALDPRPNAEEGWVKLFVSNVKEKLTSQIEAELISMKKMAEFTKDESWKDSKVKILILEHKLAAKRLNFLELYESFCSVDSYKMGFLKGDLSVMGVFRNLVLPLYNALNAEEDSSQNSKRLDIIKNKTNFKESTLPMNQRRTLYVDAIKDIEYKLREDRPIKEVLTTIHNAKIYDLPNILIDVISKRLNSLHLSEEAQAWNKAADLPISSIVRYFDYIDDKTEYATHQGVKGLEFDRVLCIIDDHHSKGHHFSFEKLLNVKELSKIDKENISAGKDSVIERTLRLFYVICTRAKKSLALVVYTQNPEKVKATAIRKEWFSENEIELI